MKDRGGEEEERQAKKKQVAEKGVLVLKTKKEATQLLKKAKQVLKEAKKSSDTGVNSSSKFNHATILIVIVLYQRLIKLTHILFTFIVFSSQN